jgi:hypothetical protein
MARQFMRERKSRCSVKKMSAVFGASSGAAKTGEAVGVEPLGLIRKIVRRCRRREKSLGTPAGSGPA